MATETPTPPTRLTLAWAAVLGSAAVLSLGVGAEGADYPTPFALSHAYVLVACAELFALLVVVPMAGAAGLLDLLLLWAMAAPVAVVAWWVSDCDAAAVAASQGHVLAVAWLVAGCLRVGQRHGRLGGWYWLAAGLFGAGAPLVAFVAGDLLALRLDWLAALSPFWVAVRLGGPWRFGWEWAAPLAATVAAASGLGLWAAFGLRHAHEHVLERR